MDLSKFNERELELLKKSLQNTADNLRETSNQLSRLDLDFHNRRRAKENQIINLTWEYEDVLRKIEKATE